MKRNTADVFSLPEGYGKLLEIDLQKDQKLSLLINLLALLIAVLAAAAGLLLRPEAPFLTSTEGGRAAASICCINGRTRCLPCAS